MFYTNSPVPRTNGNAAPPSDTFTIAEILVNDPEDLVNKGTGWMLRAAGDVDRPQLLAFLDNHAPTMQSVLLRFSIEKMERPEREIFMKKRAI